MVNKFLLLKGSVMIVIVMILIRQHNLSAIFYDNKIYIRFPIAFYCVYIMY